MSEVRLIDCDIDLRDPISGVDEGNILASARSMYEGKCYKACMITKIVEIVRNGPARITQDGRPSYATKSITMKVECLTYNCGDVITGCEVTVKNQDGSIQCRGPRAHIKLDKSPLVAPLSVGMIIPVRIVESLYPLYKDYVVLAGTLYLPANKPLAFKICRQIGNPPAGLYDRVNSQIAAEEEKLAELRKKPVWKSLESLISAPATAVPGQIDIKTADLGGSDFIVVVPQLSITVPGAIAATSAPPEAGVPIPVDPATARLQLLENYCRNLRVLREMSEIYVDDVFKANMILWRIFKTYTPK